MRSPIAVPFRRARPTWLARPLGGPSRARGQAIVEFGLVALLFTLLVFAVVDFGILLNGWISLSTAARDGARRASVGVDPATVQAEVLARSIPGVAKSSLTAQVTYSRLISGTWTPLPPSALQAPYGTCTSNCTYQAKADDRVTVTLSGNAQIVTPLVRPFFRDPTNCPGGSNPTCNVPIRNQTTMRFEGVFIQ